MDIFSKIMKIDFLKYISIFYHELGFTELYIIFILVTIIILDYVWFYLQNTKKMKKEIFSWITICFFIIVWITLMFFKFYKKWKFNYWVDIEGKGQLKYNIAKLLSPSEYRTILVLIFSYQFIILIAILMYYKLVFSKKKNFYEEQYWKISVKILMYFFITYGLVGTVKVCMGRDYYRGMEYVIYNRIDIYYEKTGDWIIFNPKWVTTPEYQPWWNFNGLIGNPQSINWSLDQLFNANAFPSGHMAQMGMVGMGFCFIINPRDKQTINWKKVVPIYLFFFHQLIMVLSFLINGSHWLTDTSFTWMWSIVTIWIANLVVDASLDKIGNKKNTEIQNFK
ncbi:phosphatase PAP2 family protein [Spiroplasma floricola 23-6]|uniref:Phosphatase PAP2 family protein n=2 Tax=Spiroplasma floricola TaxID=216937 RepID=A0A2K8SET0_9MOLU|nr:phosphatase PAP2 family protein [Spiroplasma floricola 23-6]